MSDDRRSPNFFDEYGMTTRFSVNSKSLHIAQGCFMRRASIKNPAAWTRVLFSYSLASLTSLYLIFGWTLTVNKLIKISIRKNAMRRKITFPYMYIYKTIIRTFAHHYWSEAIFKRIPRGIYTLSQERAILIWNDL